jgi:IPT/TIG domain
MVCSVVEPGQLISGGLMRTKQMAPTSGRLLAAIVVWLCISLAASPPGALAATPTVSEVVPASGPVLGGTQVAVTGAGFSAGVKSVAFGSVQATSFAAHSDTSLTVVAPPGNAGTVDVTVTTTGGTSSVSAGDRFTYHSLAAGDIFTAMGDGPANNACEHPGVNCGAAATGWATSFNALMFDGIAVDRHGNYIVGANSYPALEAEAASNSGYLCEPSCAGGDWVVGNVYALASGASENQTTAGITVDPEGNIVYADYYPPVGGHGQEAVVLARSASNPGYACAPSCQGADWVRGSVYTILGDGSAGYASHGGSALSAPTRSLEGVSIDRVGNVIVTDPLNHVVQLVAVSTRNPGYVCQPSCGSSLVAGNVYTLAGTGHGGYNGDGRPAISARLQYPNDAVADADGNVLIGDSANSRLRLVAVSATNPGYRCFPSCTAGSWIHGRIYTIAGTGSATDSGDGSSGLSAGIDGPDFAALDSSQDILFTESFGGRLRILARSATNPGYRLQPCPKTCFWQAGDVYTLAGNGREHDSGDDGPATAAELNGPVGLAFDPRGDILVQENGFGGNRLRIIEAAGPVPNVGLTTLRIAPGAFRAAKSGGSLTRRLPHVRLGKTPIGTRVGFSVRAAALVRFQLERLENRTVYAVLPGSFLVAAAAGANHFLFTGRLAGHALAPGRYRLIGAVASGAQVSAGFRILA